MSPVRDDGFRSDRPWAEERHQWLDDERWEQLRAERVEDNRPDPNARFSDDHGPDLPDGYTSSDAYRAGHEAVALALGTATDRPDATDQPEGATDQPPAAPDRPEGATRCVGCREVFVPRRRDARFCSTGCRQRTWRRGGTSPLENDREVSILGAQAGP